MTSRLLSLVALVSILFVSVVPPGRAEDVDPEPPVTEFFDSFNGKLRLKWEIVRPDAKHYSLTRNKGKLTITTQKGTIHLSDPNAAKVRNLFLIGNPCGRGRDFEV